MTIDENGKVTFASQEEEFMAHGFFDQQRDQQHWAVNFDARFCVYVGKRQRSSNLSLAAALCEMDAIHRRYLSDDIYIRMLPLLDTDQANGSAIAWPDWPREILFEEDQAYLNGVRFWTLQKKEKKG